MWALADLGGAFADWRLFYVENDSTDDTRRLLASFARRFPGRIFGESLDGFSPSPSAFLCPPRFKAMNCLERTALLAVLRQRLLGLVLSASWPALGVGAGGGGGGGAGETAHARGLPSSDVMLMLDVDFVSFSKPNYLRAFASASRHRAAGFFASSVYKDKWGGLQPYDSSAVVPRRHENSTATCERWQSNMRVQVSAGRQRVRTRIACTLLCAHHLVRVCPPACPSARAVLAAEAKAVERVPRRGARQRVLGPWAAGATALHDARAIGLRRLWHLLGGCAASSGASLVQYF